MRCLRLLVVFVVGLLVDVQVTTSLRCLPLSVPHGKVVCDKAQMLPLTRCNISCQKGYEVAGSPVRACLYNGYWSQTKATYCRPPPCTRFWINNGRVVYAQKDRHDWNVQEVGSSAKVVCFVGYKLEGDAKVTCQFDSTWSKRPTCKPIKCPALSKPSVGQLTPRERCNSGNPVRIYTICTIVCPGGYVISNKAGVSHSSKSLVCMDPAGTWTEPVPKCIDVRPPDITNCPTNGVETNTDPGKGYAVVRWPVKVDDNSKWAGDPNAKITVTSSPPSASKFSIGDTPVVITATDAAGNKRTCHFNVRVQDREPPKLLSCPPNIVKEVSGSRAVRVTWERPHFADNSGRPATVFSSIHTGSQFHVPGHYKVAYSASDSAGNYNHYCAFTITLKVKTCPMYPPPVNGALVCHTRGTDKVCMVACQRGYDFARYPGMLYMCNRNGKWHPFGWYPGSNTLPWPGCTKRASHGRMPSQLYYSGNARDPNVQALLKNNFRGMFISNVLPPPFCMPCETKNMVVYA